MKHQRASALPRAGQPRNAQDLFEMLRRIEDEGGGIWDIEVISALDVNILEQGELAGDQRALRLIKLILGVLFTRGYVGSCCLFCPQGFSAGRPPPAFVVVSAGNAGPESGAMISPLCAECYRRDDLSARIFGFWKRLAPDMRLISPGPASRQ